MARKSLSNYAARPALPRHVAEATVLRDSEELIIEEHDLAQFGVETVWLVASPNRTSELFRGRYYVVAQVEGVWKCSSRDEFLAAKLIEQVQQHLACSACQQEAAQGRYYPVFRGSQGWVRFLSRGQDVGFTSEAEARAYLRGVVGETDVEFEPQRA